MRTIERVIFHTKPLLRTSNWTFWGHIYDATTQPVWSDARTTRKRKKTIASSSTWLVLMLFTGADFDVYCQKFVRSKNIANLQKMQKMMLVLQNVSHWRFWVIGFLCFRKLLVRIDFVRFPYAFVRHRIWNKSNSLKMFFKMISKLILNFIVALCVCNFLADDTRITETIDKQNVLR